MTFSFRPAKRESVGLMIGLAGGTGSGKTYSALKLATGLAGGKPFALIDTEAGRAKHYADIFAFEHGNLGPPFRPEVYTEAIVAADKANYPVIVVDSASHEYAGAGGLLEWHDEELDRMAGNDWKKREAMTFSAWVTPKGEHKKFVNRLLQLKAHLILCFRAEEKIEIVKEGNKTVVRPKKTLTGLDGWVPICEKSLPYELTLSFLLTADAPGYPKPIKLQEQHRPFVPLDQPIDEETGKLLATWAQGAKDSEPPSPPPEDGGSDAAKVIGEEDAATDGLASASSQAATQTEPGHGAQGDPATGPSLSPPDETPRLVTTDELVQLVREHKIDDETFKAVGRRLFPGRTGASLSDEERGQFWAELDKDLVKETA